MATATGIAVAMITAFVHPGNHCPSTFRGIDGLMIDIPWVIIETDWPVGLHCRFII